MAWLGSDVYLIGIFTMLIAEVGIAARRYATRPHYRRVPHRKLRAAHSEEARGRDQRTIHAPVAGSQTSPIDSAFVAEPGPRHALKPGAGCRTDASPSPSLE